MRRVARHRHPPLPGPPGHRLGRAAAGRRLARLTPLLLAVPNVSEGRDRAILEAIGAAFAGAGARVLDLHADPDHHRAVFTLAGEPRGPHPAVAAGARAAVERIDLGAHVGVHPRVGAVDVAPIVHRT